MSTTPIRREKWHGDASVRVTVKSAGIADKDENRKVLDACVGEYDAVRLRVAIGAYGPGTTAKPTPRYWWLLGTNASVTCRNQDVAEWFVGELQKWMESLDGVVLEVVQ